MPLIINAELQSLIPPLTTEEYTQLEANIRADGCHDPLIVWQEEQTLLDGHNRYDICERHEVGYTTQEVRLADVDAAKEWIIANQLGRRNLTPEQMSYFRGKQYDMQKRQGQRTDLTSGQNEQKLQTTAAQLAQQHTVSEATIRRDASYAQAVDTIAEVAGPAARQALLARDTKITQQDAKQLAAVARVSPNTAKEAIANVQFAKTPKTVKRIVQTAVEAVQKEVAQGGSGNLAEAGVPRAPLDRLLPRPATDGAPQGPRPWLEAFLRDALAGLRALHKALEAASLPDALDPLMENCIAFGKAYRQIECLLVKHDVIRRALVGLPATPPKTAPASPAPAAPVSQPAPGAQRKSGALIAVVWEALQRHQPCTNAQVAQVTGEQRKHVYKALQSLVKQGKACKQGQTYSVVGTPGVERDD